MRQPGIAPTGPPRRVWRLLPFVSWETERRLRRALASLFLLLAVVVMWLAIQPLALKETTATGEELQMAEYKLQELIAARVENQQITRGFRAEELNAYFMSLVKTRPAAGPWLPRFNRVEFEVRNNSVLMYEISSWDVVGLKIFYWVEAVPYVSDGRPTARVREAGVGRLRVPRGFQGLVTRRFRRMFREITASPLYGTLPAAIEVRGGEVWVTNSLAPSRR